MRILVACEESQAVTLAMRAKGHEAFSCDIKPCSGGKPEWHIVGDAIEVAYSQSWHLMIAHPPCQYLSSAGLHWCTDKHGSKAIERKKLRDEAKDFFFKLWQAPIDKICIENPAGYIKHFLKHTQLVNPYYFGEPHRKRTLLYLKNLPLLRHYAKDDLFDNRTHVKPIECLTTDKSGKRRHFTDTLRKAEERSKTFASIATAMAEQWS